MTAIVDYGAGNLTSVKLAFSTLEADAEITSSPERIRSAERVVFPGVGAAGSAMTTLRELGLVDTLRAVVDSGTPFLGICLGTQIVFESSEEDEGTDCIGIIPGTVRRFQPTSPYDKIPQMGWNAVSQVTAHPVFEGIADESEFYFVHSYYPDPAQPELVIGRTDYAGTAFASVTARDNLVATQFHPEKSGRVGLQLLRNFIEWQPC
jgi:glutamine amidotransferase